MTEALQWVFPSNTQGGIYSPVSFGPVHFHDVIQLQWVPTTYTVKNTDGVTLACELSDGSFLEFNTTSFSSPYQWTFNQVVKQSPVTCHFAFSSGGNWLGIDTDTFKYVNTAAAAVSTWAASSASSTASQTNAASSSSAASTVSSKAVSTTTSSDSSPMSSQTPSATPSMTTSITSTSSFITSTSTSSSTDTPSISNSTNQSGLSPGAGAGIGVGIAIPVTIIICFGIFFFRRSRNSKKVEDIQDYPLVDSSKLGDSESGHFGGAELVGEGRKYNTELEAREKAQVYEMSAQRKSRLYEMGGNESREEWRAELAA